MVDTQGYVYCLSNLSYNGTYKVGFTVNDPTIRMSQLNTTGVVYPFTLEFAKKVYNYKKKEKLLHGLLTRYGKRANPKREFFKIPLEEIKALFELMDGEWFDVKSNTNNSDDNNNMNIINVKKPFYKRLFKCLYNRQYNNKVN
jgi:hypothetical protein